MNDDQHTTDDQDDVLFWARLEHIIGQAMAALTPQDIARRVEFCQRTGQHGISVDEADSEGTAVRLVWGGKTLAVIARDVFAPDAFMEDLSTTVMHAAPDDARALTED